MYSIEELKDIIDKQFIKLDNYLDNASFEKKYFKDLINQLRER